MAQGRAREFVSSGLERRNRVRPSLEGCEVDHLISRELGGADEEDNLWPQPYTQHPGAHEKDWLENELHEEVCRGKISLVDAQNEIKEDWYKAHLKRKTH